jgi:DNA-binding NtrC family response regulator
MTATGRILVIDDEEAICFAFQRYFQPRGYRVQVASTVAAGLAAYTKEPAEVVFLDVRLPDGDGLELLGRLCEMDPQARVIVITAHGSLQTVTRAIRGRAFEYLVKPIDLDRAGELVEQVRASREAVRTAAPPAAAPAPASDGEPVLVGRSPAIQEVFKRIGRVAESDSSVLILGETGTGKELVARAIHRHSRRRTGPFVAVNCGALPESLVESELFGYARGAFTGAAAAKEGRFEAADGGTLFFDEIGDLPLPAQVKLLRFLDSQTVERLGSVDPIGVDVRVLAATNQDLAAAMAAGRFRPDLYYRLAVTQIMLPRLAARIEDVQPLAQHFLAQRTPAGQAPPILSREAAAILDSYLWPGNVRELRNAVEHAAIASGGGPILPVHLPEAVRQGLSATNLDTMIEEFAKSLGGQSCHEVIDRLEKALIRRALAEAGGNQSVAAERLGLHRNTLRNKLRDLGLDG